MQNTKQVNSWTPCDYCHRREAVVPVEDGNVFLCKVCAERAELKREISELFDSKVAIDVEGSANFDIKICFRYLQEFSKTDANKILRITKPMATRWFMTFKYSLLSLLFAST